MQNYVKKNILKDKNKKDLLNFGGNQRKEVNKKLCQAVFGRCPQKQPQKNLTKSIKNTKIL